MARALYDFVRMRSKQFSDSHAMQLLDWTRFVQEIDLQLVAVGIVRMVVLI